MIEKHRKIKTKIKNKKVFLSLLSEYEYNEILIKMYKVKNFLFNFMNMARRYN